MTARDAIRTRGVRMNQSPYAERQSPVPDATKSGGQIEAQPVRQMACCEMHWTDRANGHCDQTGRAHRSGAPYRCCEHGDEIADA